MNIDQAQRAYDKEEPIFDYLECEVDDCENDAEEEFKGHWLCSSCFNNILEEPRGEIAMSVLGRVR